MKVKPGTLAPLLPRYPKFGTYRGRRVALSDVEATLKPAQWAAVEVTVDGEAVRPWAGLVHSVEGDDGAPLGPL